MQLWKPWIRGSVTVTTKRRLEPRSTDHRRLWQIGRRPAPWLWGLRDSTIPAPASERMKPRTTSWDILSRPLRQAQGRLFGTGPDSHAYPGLASWATLSRPCGTDMCCQIPPRTHRAGLSAQMAFWTAQLAEYVEENVDKRNRVGAVAVLPSIHLHQCQGGDGWTEL